MKKEILKMCSGLTLSEIQELRTSLADLYREKIENDYKTVRIYPGERIEEKIKNETGFYCYHEKPYSSPMGRGTHIIVIPIEKYSDRLENELISKYDDKW